MWPFAELMFLETSAMTGENVEETFLKCAKSILAKIESGKCQPGFPSVHIEDILISEIIIVNFLIL